MSDLELLSYYLGIEVRQSSESITLCQARYARKILEKLGMGGVQSLFDSHGTKNGDEQTWEWRTCG